MQNVSHLRIASLLFSIMAGIINIFGIKHLGLVVTNVTGHFSNLALGDKIGNTHLYFEIIGYILVYFLGSFSASSCFWHANSRSNHLLKVLVPSSILLILVFAFFIDKVSVYFFFFLSSAQNSFASNHSNGEIKPSQITGVVMNSGFDLSQYFFSKENKKSKMAVFQSFTCKLLNILGFSIGIFIGFHEPKNIVLLLPIIFYTLATVLVFYKKF